MHRLSSKLIRHNDLVSIADLNIRGLTRTKLATSILDAGWEMFRVILADRAERQNKPVIPIGHFFP